MSLDNLYTFRYYSPMFGWSDVNAFFAMYTRQAMTTYPDLYEGHKIVQIERPIPVFAIIL